MEVQNKLSRVESQLPESVQDQGVRRQLFRLRSQAREQLGADVDGQARDVCVLLRDHVAFHVRGRKLGRVVPIHR